MSELGTRPAMRSLRGLAPLLFLVAFTGEARAETISIEELEQRIDQLAEGPAGEVAPAEIARARELLRQAGEARAAGRQGVAEGILALIPLQIQLIEELLRVAEAEDRADEAQRRLIEVTRQARVEREALERILERLAALSVLGEEG